MYLGIVWVIRLLYLFLLIINEDTKNSSIEYSKDKLIFSLPNMKNYFSSVLFFWKKDKFTFYQKGGWKWPEWIMGVLDTIRWWKERWGVSFSLTKTSEISFLFHSSLGTTTCLAYENPIIANSAFITLIRAEQKSWLLAEYGKQPRDNLRSLTPLRLWIGIPKLGGPKGCYQENLQV